MIMRILFFSFIMMCACNLKAQREIIEITQGHVKPEPIAIVKNYSDSFSFVAKKIDQVIMDDLQSSGLFEIMDPDGYMQDGKSLLEKGPIYKDWSLTKTRFLYFSSFQRDGGKMTIKFQLHDVMRGEKMLSLTLTSDESKWRRVAHMIADAVYQSVTGDDGFFNTQIAFVQPTNQKGRNLNTCIKIMDSDGDPDSIMQLTDGNSLVLTPRYAPDGKSLVYVRMDKNSGEVYIIDRVSKVNKLMGRYKGLNFAPRYAPDGKRIVFSISKGTTTAIYEQHLYSKQLTQLTEHTGIDTSPGYSPDGEKIVFVSDRAGRPQLYVMNKDGTNQQRISSKNGTYTQPCWSPRGDLIAYTFQQSGQFYIGLMKPDGSEERLIATSYLVEDPIWTSNGRYLFFTVQASLGKKQHIIRADLTGQHQYELKTPGEAFGASLSPLLGRITP